MAATVGVKEGGMEVAEQVGALGLQDVVAWGCGLCQGHLPAASAVVVVAVAGTVVGRAGTVVVAVVAVVVVVVAVAAAIAFPVAAVAFDPVGPLRGKAILRWRDLRVLALVLGKVLTLRKWLPVVVPWLLRLLSVWGPTYWALGVTYCTYLFIGLDPFSNWALGFLGVTGFRGLEHGMYRRVFELGLNEMGSAIQLVPGCNVIHGQNGPVCWGGVGD
ncbi:hypothetical protein Taro_030556 [Colocasia esculenta]|uniref:Uncharacterized protein n=1 Tax=Colocasia esculenta TaxID=4460 RepID=A0A843VWG7_COLES|nr:hypothetical protein [Colocasia esculenta]